MAEDDTPPPQAQDDTIPEVDASEEDRASAGADEAEESQSVNTIRSRGSKVSNLRAAFEQGGTSSAVQRPLSADSRSITPNGRLQTFDADFARLKECMAKEQEQRAVDRKRLEAQAVEIEALKQQLESTESKQQQAPVELQEHHEELYNDEEGEQYAGEDDIDAEREELYIALHEAKAHIEGQEAESNALRAQLADMKKSIATNTRIETHEITDSAFQGELGTLCYQIQDWVINRFRKTKIEGSAKELVVKVPIDSGSRMEEDLRSLLYKWDPAAKMLFLQSAVVTLMMPIFEDPMLYGLPSKVEWSDAIRAASHGLQEILDETAYNRWRATTLDIICHSEAMSPFVHSAANRIVGEICAAIDQITASSTTEAQTDALRNVVRRVIALSHSLRVQRAVYHVQLPAPETSFDERTMEDTFDDGYEGAEERSIRCAVFPLVTKPGDAGQRSIIFKARVS